MFFFGEVVVLLLFLGVEDFCFDLYFGFGGEGVFVGVGFFFFCDFCVFL